MVLGHVHERCLQHLQLSHFISDKAVVILFEYILHLGDVIKEELTHFSDSSEDCVSDGCGSVNNGMAFDTASQVYREKIDAANLRSWSPNGLFPTLSSFVQPLLHGAPMSAERRKTLSGRLRDEIIQFLNDHRLIQNKNTSAKRWEYCALGRSLAERYPRMPWERASPGTKIYSRKKNCWSVFIQRLSACRKTQKWRMMRKLQDANTMSTTTATLTTSSTSEILNTPTTPATSTTPTTSATPTLSTALEASIKQE